MRFATFGLRSGNVFLPSQMQCVAFGRRSGEISRRSPMRFCFPLTCLNHLVGERLPSSTRQQKCGGTREHSRMCASTQQRAPSAQLACKPHFPVERKVVNTFPSSSVALRACRHQQKCGGAREHRRMCASTEQRAKSAQVACKPHLPAERKAAIALPSSDVALCASCQCKTAGHLPHGPRDREQV